jgi:hypothetical protein
MRVCSVSRPILRPIQLLGAASGNVGCVAPRRVSACVTERPLVFSYIPLNITVGKRERPRRTHNISPRPCVAREHLLGLGAAPGRNSAVPVDGLTTINLVDSPVPRVQFPGRRLIPLVCLALSVGRFWRWRERQSLRRGGRSYRFVGRGIRFIRRAYKR